MASKKTIKLKKIKGGAEQTFDFAHALSILRLEKKLGHREWEIAEKNWKFDNNEIYKRRATGDSGESETS